VENQHITESNIGGNSRGNEETLTLTNSHRNPHST